ncbi:DUF6538 domain-containing protein [Bradyrhizobium vignae]|uniref:DUF6538 domain-containing protein n=1 Tax=Bradyrhizobium vignae TaxID=1549949 RepID=A0ABS4A596_9BRAD|nr:DUF6538 domain-containing protein [Bradyrhizobium vignae]MBP0115584.1 hypothetical protein [Bradyrhizobium vignae]
MACPTKRPGSDNWYFRKRIPADVQAILADLPKTQRPAHWYKDQISISLGTADRSIAKATCPDVAAQVERTMAALRAGPKPRNVNKINAPLSGELYMGLAEVLEGNSNSERAIVTVPENVGRKIKSECASRGRPAYR